jgi:outer membrane protein TolC
MLTTLPLLTGKKMLIKAGLAIMLLSAAAPLNAQVSGNTAASDSISAIEEKLVQLALNGPVMKELQHRNRINELELTRAQRNWINLLTFSANYNDQSFAKDAPGTVVYPRYFFGVTVPLGTILSRTEVKSARENIAISKLNQEQLARAIRAEVLTKYRQYRAYDQLIDMQGELLNDVQASLLQTEDKFRKGLVDVEVYTAAQRSKSEVAARQVNLQLEQDLIKIDLEKLIGTRLDSVIR